MTVDQTDHASSTAIDKCLLRLVAAYLDKDGRRGFATDLREMADRLDRPSPEARSNPDEAADAGRFRRLTVGVNLERKSVDGSMNELEFVLVRQPLLVVPRDTGDDIRSLIDAAFSYPFIQPLAFP